MGTTPSTARDPSMASQRFETSGSSTAFQSSSDPSEMLTTSNELAKLSPALDHPTASQSYETFCSSTAFQSSSEPSKMLTTSNEPTTPFQVSRSPMASQSSESSGSSTKTEMFTLPNEMLLEIIKRLPRKDIRNLRLTCNVFAALGAITLFEEVCIVTHPSSVEHFLKICQQPEYAKYVKRIRYDILFFCDDPADFDQWEEFHLELPSHINAKDLPPFPPLSFDSSDDEAKAEAAWEKDVKLWEAKYSARALYTKEQKAEGWFAYLNLVSQIEKYWRNDRNFVRFRKALNRLSNLEKIEVSGDIEADIQSRPLKLRDVNMKMLGDHDAQFSSQHFAFILQSMNIGNPKLKHLAAHQIDWAVFDEKNDPLPEPLLLPNFTKLKHLELAFPRYGRYSELRHQSIQSIQSHTENTFGRLLREAKDLEVLCLSFMNSADAFEGRIGVIDLFMGPSLLPLIQLEQLTKNTTWPNLKTLHLQAVDMTEEHATGFMQRHSGTLKSLHLGDVFLLKGTWDSTLRSFKKSLSLQECKFSGIFGVPHPNQVGFNPMFHLPMQDEVHMGFLNRGRRETLGGSGHRYLLRETLGESVRKYFLEEDENADPLKDWGHGVLPEGVTYISYSEE